MYSTISGRRRVSVVERTRAPPKSMIVGLIVGLLVGVARCSGVPTATLLPDYGEYGTEQDRQVGRWLVRNHLQ
jgi:hypothetical protein